MRIQIRAIGICRGTPENELIDIYMKRLETAHSIGIGQTHIHEIKTIKARRGQELKKLEAQKLLDSLPLKTKIVALDETGEDLTSQDFAAYLQKNLHMGTQNLTFIIGGASGLDEAICQAADLTLSLGRMTLPHLLARVFLVEQLWRAVSILTNHPYHRA